MVMSATRLNARRGVVVLARSSWRCGERQVRVPACARLISWCCGTRYCPGGAWRDLALVPTYGKVLCCGCTIESCIGETYAVRELILWARGVLNVADEGVGHRLGA